MSYKSLSLSSLLFLSFLFFPLCCRSLQSFLSTTTVTHCLCSLLGYHLDEDWIKVKTTKERQPAQDPTDERTEAREERTEKEAPIVEKKISRQERRAQLRLAAKEKKKQARNALRKSTNCILSSGPLSIDH
ncbi:hypothetical protein AB4K20DRAFT_1871364 [Rhizopus microsporus]